MKNDDYTKEDFEADMVEVMKDLAHYRLGKALSPAQPIQSIVEDGVPPEQKMNDDYMKEEFEAGCCCCCYCCYTVDSYVCCARV